MAEIPGLIADYVRAAHNAIAADFNGVQIHAANGQLIDRFLRDNSKARTDEYAAASRTAWRLLVQVTWVVARVVGGSHLGPPLPRRKLSSSRAAAELRIMTGSGARPGT